MLQDYPQFTDSQIGRKETEHKWKKRFITLGEFLLIMVMLQAVLAFFQPHEAEEAVRYRILAHSDAPGDQAIKLRIQQEVEPLIASALADAVSPAEIDAALAGLEAEMLEAAQRLSVDRPVVLERKDALFPAKRTGLWISPQDTYDAYVMTIGSGKGSNWWCSVFPKVCYEDEKEEEEPVKFFVWEWITSFFA